MHPKKKHLIFEDFRGNTQGIHTALTPGYCPSEHS